MTSRLHRMGRSGTRLNGTVSSEFSISALRAGTAVALMRHADAPGVGDPAGYKLEDCFTQRNLSERGKTQAAAVGALFR
jgi:hypothetical protein